MPQLDIEILDNSARLLVARGSDLRGPINLALYESLRFARNTIDQTYTRGWSEGSKPIFQNSVISDIDQAEGMMIYQGAKGFSGYGSPWVWVNEGTRLHQIKPGTKTPGVKYMPMVMYDSHTHAGPPPSFGGPGLPRPPKRGERRNVSPDKIAEYRKKVSQKIVGRNFMTHFRQTYGRPGQELTRIFEQSIYNHILGRGGRGFFGEAWTWAKARPR